MATRAPHPALAGAVHRYVGYVERSAETVRRREVPQDQVTVILGFGTPLSIGGAQLAAHGCDSFVAPLSDAYAITEFSGVSQGIQIDDHPCRESRTTRFPATERIACRPALQSTRFARSATRCATSPTTSVDEQQTTSRFPPVGPSTSTLPSPATAVRAGLFSDQARAARVEPRAILHSCDLAALYAATSPLRARGRWPLVVHPVSSLGLLRGPCRCRST